jgi:hypothetical protein
MCVAAAVSELEQDYGERVDFVLVSPEETKQRSEELAGYGLGSHGLVAFAADGSVRARLPGHEFGRDEIVAATEAALE